MIQQTIELSNKADRDEYVKKGAVGPLKDDTSIFQSLRVALGGQQGVTQPYAQNVWVYASVRAISENIARVPFRFFKEGRKREGRKAEKILIEEGKINELFKNPNPLIAPEQLFEATLTFLSLSGESFWILEGRENVTQLPKEMWAVSPDRVEPVIEKSQNMLAGWKYKGAKETNYGLHQILQFKYFNPYDDIRGLSPVHAFQAGVDQDFFATKYNEQFFRKGAMPGGYIESEKVINDIQFNQLKNQFEDRHAGFSNAHKIGILGGGLKFHEAKTTQRDMEFIEQKKLTRHEIFAAYKVNDVILGIFQDVKSKEGSKTAHQAFWRECLIPKMQYIEGVLWSKLFSKINGGKIWGEFDLSVVEALQEDFNKKVEMAESLFRMGYGINDINEKMNLGMPNVEGGDIGHLPIGLVPVGSGGILSNNDAKCITVQPKRLPPPATKLPGKDGSPLEVNLQVGKQPDNDMRWKQFLTIQIPMEKLFLKKFGRFLVEQRTRVLKNLRTFQKKDLTDSIFDELDEERKLKKLIAPLYTAAIQTGAENVAAELGVAGFVFDPLKPSYLGPMELKLTRIPPILVGTVKEQLRNTLTQGISAGETVAELVKRVRAEYKVTMSRAFTIARTESASSISSGRFAEMGNQQVERHQWITATDEAVRDSHIILHGETTVVGELFGGSPLRHPGDMSAPASEVLNCRCVAVPFIEGG